MKSDVVHPRARFEIEHLVRDPDASGLLDCGSGRSRPSRRSGSESMNGRLDLLDRAIVRIEDQCRAEPGSDLDEPSQPNMTSLREGRLEVQLKHPSCPRRNRQPMFSGPRPRSAARGASPDAAQRPATSDLRRISAVARSLARATRSPSAPETSWSDSLERLGRSSKFGDEVRVRRRLDLHGQMGRDYTATHALPRRDDGHAIDC